MISVVIPLWNKEAYIERCVRSVLAQTFGDFEVIVVDDGSTDQSATIVRQINDNRIRLITQSNAGVSAARNTGISHALYPYIAFLDADDEWEPHHLEVIRHLIEAFPLCGLFSTCYTIQKEGGTKTSPDFPKDKLPFRGSEGILDNYYEIASDTNAPLNMNTFAVRKELIEQIGGFPIGIKSGEDLITIARLHAICDFAYSLQPTTTVHLIYTGRNRRPVSEEEPLNACFDALLTTARHRKGIRSYVSSWHKNRMVRAIYAKNFRLAFKEFFRAFRIHPLQRKIYIAFTLTCFSVLSGKDLYSINRFIKRKL